MVAAPKHCRFNLSLCYLLLCHLSRMGDKKEKKNKAATDTLK